MKKLLVLTTMLLTFGFANAQCKIYSGTYASSSKQVGLVEGGGMMCGAAAAFLLLF